MSFRGSLLEGFKIFDQKVIFHHQSHGSDPKKPEEGEVLLQ